SREPRLADDKRKVLKLLEACAPDGPLSVFTVAFFGGQGGSPDHIRLTTLHSAKGLEYDVVVLMGLEEGRIPSYSDGTVRGREERPVPFAHGFQLDASSNYLFFTPTIRTNPILRFPIEDQGEIPINGTNPNSGRRPVSS